VIGGLGVSVLSRHTLESDTPSKRFAVLNVQGFPIKRHWYFVHPAGKQLSIVARTFADYLRKASRD
jgi:LysR family transcriptional regulator, low CO2-responsive transcriptional regulator